MADLEQFRAETRAWLAANCPPGARGPGQVPWGSSRIPLEPDVALWLQRMADQGWTVPTWPREYGGADLSRDEYLVLMEELRRIDARTPLTGRGVNYIGPTILEFGTDEQKARWLPRCARGEGGWCMGYSEPGAGSDLANLSMKAELRGDHYVINGSKLWTSDAVDSDLIFALVRTDTKAPKHEGISLILIDMHQPGVRVRPIRLISGDAPFNETQFVDAIAPKDDIIGPLNHGWTVGKRLLQFERSTHAGVNISGTQGRVVEDALPDIFASALGRDASGRIAAPALRGRLLDYEMNARIHRMTQRRVMEEMQARAPGFASSVVKLAGALLQKERHELHVAALGHAGVGWGEDGIDAGAYTPSGRDATRTWLRQKSLTIAGGTAEIQLNIIAKRVLGLPDATPE
jgi:alkylation response protein AidB-like acyl-CoA dehydrogenase